MANAEARVALGRSENEQRSVQRAFCARDAICAQVGRAADVNLDPELHAITAASRPPAGF